jgi:solute carrier family 25 S-adenosylmethionine transporter 26
MNCPQYPSFPGILTNLQTRIQIDHPVPFRLAGVYGGVGGRLHGQVPYGVLTFGSYEIYKKSLIERFPNVKPVFIYAIAAILGDLTGSGWLCPSGVVKQQTQAGMFKSTREAFTSILKIKGVAGLYQGFWGGVARDVPFRVAQLTSYEITKSIYLKMKARRQTISESSMSGVESKLELSPIESALLCGVIADTFSAAVTCPLDCIKTLLVTNGAEYGGSVVSCATKIISEEGMAGMMTGMIPRVVYIAPSVAVFFLAYEATQQKLKHWS